LSSSSHYNFNGKGGVSALAATAFDPTTSFRGLFFSDQRTGRGSVRSFPRWNMDAGLTKKTTLTERTSMTFGVQAVNVFNHMEFVDPTLDVKTPSTFGTTSTQYSQPRFLNLAIRVDF
jgi:hypothetical protein